MVTAATSRSSRRLRRVSAGLAVLVSGALALSLTPLADGAPHHVTATGQTPQSRRRRPPGDHIVSHRRRPG